MLFNVNYFSNIYSKKVGLQHKISCQAQKIEAISAKEAMNIVKEKIVNNSKRFGYVLKTAETGMTLQNEAKDLYYVITDMEAIAE